MGHHPARTSGGTILAYVDIYYSSSTGMNCARLNSHDRVWGEEKWMRVELVTCRQTVDPGNRCTPLDGDNPRYYDEDSGWFSYYAGPVSVYGRGRCIGWLGEVASYTSGIAQTEGAGHCG